MVTGAGHDEERAGVSLDVADPIPPSSDGKARGAVDTNGAGRSCAIDAGLDRVALPSAKGITASQPDVVRSGGTECDFVVQTRPRGEDGGVVTVIGAGVRQGDHIAA